MKNYNYISKFLYKSCNIGLQFKCINLFYSWFTLKKNHIQTNSINIHVQYIRINNISFHREGSLTNKRELCIKARQ